MARRQSQQCRLVPVRSRRCTTPVNVWPSVGHARLQFAPSILHGRIDPRLVYKSDWPVSRSKNVIPQWQAFFISALSPMISSVLTNPIDVITVRMQMSPYGKYKSAFDCLHKVVKDEGIKVLGLGLGAGMFKQGVGTGTKIALYQPVMKNLFHQKADSEDNKPPLHVRLMAGAICGIIGAIPGNPIEFVKTRIQGHHIPPANAMGIIKSVVKTGTVMPFFQGIEARMAKSSVAMATTITTYTFLRDFLVERKIFGDDERIAETVASLAAAAVTTLVVNPLDLIRTRLFDQPIGPDGQGLLYENAMDAARKIIKSDGVRALYQGLFVNFLNRGPAMVISFGVFEHLHRSALKANAHVRQSAALRSAFESLDRDHNGAIDEKELAIAYMAAFPSLPSARLWAIVRNIMSRADSDHDGYIQFNEFSHVSRELINVLDRQALRATFRALDVDESGTITRMELEIGLKTLAPYDIQQHLSRQQYEALIDSQVDAMMAAADTNGDGRVEFKEFEKVIHGVQDVNLHRAMRGWLVNAGINDLA